MLLLFLGGALALKPIWDYDSSGGLKYFSLKNVSK